MSTERAIEKAKKDFDDPSYRQIKDALRNLKESRSDLEKILASRKAKTNEKLEHEKADLEKYLASSAETQRTIAQGDAALAKSLATIQKNLEDARRTQVKQSEQLANIERGTDDALFAWLDQMMELSVQALNDPNAFEVAKNILAGGIVVGGLFPHAAIAAAIVSGVIVIRDTIEAADPRKRNDKFAERQKQLDSALELLKAVTALSGACAEILSASQ